MFLRPIGARSEDRLLWTLKRSRDNPSPSFFSLHMNFSTSSLYSVVFVVAFVFFSYCLACRALRFTRKPAKCRICCKQGYLLPCLLYSTHDSFLIVVFDANSCNLHLFFKVVSSQRLLVARLMIGVFPRLLRAILQPLSPPAKIVNKMNLSKNRIQLFILSGQIFLNYFSKSFFFCVFPNVVFLKTY